MGCKVGLGGSLRDVAASRQGCVPGRQAGRHPCLGSDIVGSRSDSKYICMDPNNSQGRWEILLGEKVGFSETSSPVARELESFAVLMAPSSGSEEEWQRFLKDSLM